MNSILIVDDNREDLRSATSLLESLQDVKVVQAESAAEAVDYLSDSPATVVVTDLNMPGMSGLDLLHLVRRQHPDTPVIVMTGHGSEEIAAVALNDGASGYVPKRMLDSQLLPIVTKILDAVDARRDMHRLEEVLDFTETRFVLDNENELATPIVGYIQEKVNRLLPFDENDLVQIGLAIDEALKNAIYHGNLEVGSELREADDGSFHELARQRRSQSPFAGRKVEVICRVSSQEFECVIRDQGNGFRVNDVPDPLAPENLEKASGRGLLLIHQFMDEVRHNEQANEITMIKRRPKKNE
jgi:CheY-like chemotaxis protein